VSVHTYDGLPGAELVLAGLADLASGTESEAALLVAVGAPRLRSLGVPVPAEVQRFEHPEMQLYRRAGTHGRYRSLIRRLVSFERSLARRRR
jgi:hypothetical protein